MIKIIADSCCDLSSTLLDQYGISVIPLSVFVNEHNYQDGIEISSDQLFEYVKKTGKLPKTSAPSVALFTNEFQKFKEFIYISISSKLSSSLQSAQIASSAVLDTKLQLIDSFNLSTGIGLLLLRAAELSQSGKSLEEIVNEINTLIPKVNTSFVIDTLDYLYLGGRCSSMEHVVGSLLKIHPVIEVKKDGTLGVREKVSGSRKKALGALLKNFQKNKDLVDPSRVFVTHAACPEDADYLKDELLNILDINEILITEAGSTISSHCGPNCIGILYLTK